MKRDYKTSYLYQPGALFAHSLAILLSLLICFFTTYSLPIQFPVLKLCQLCLNSQLFPFSMIGTSVKRKGKSSSVSAKRSKLTPDHGAGNVSYNNHSLSQLELQQLFQLAFEF